MKFHVDEEERTDVSLTPLIDVVFLLLIFFMITTTFNQHAKLRIDLPEASSAEQSIKEVKIEVIVDKNGHYYVDGVSLVDQKNRTLTNALSKVAERDKTEKVLIRADAQAPHQSVVSVMDAASKLGLTQVSIATSSDQDNAK